MSGKKKIQIALLFVLLVALSFFREFVFLNINEQCRVTYYHATDSHVAPIMTFLGSFSYTQLYYSKWALTLFFPFLFMLLSCVIVLLIFEKKEYVKWTVLTYTGVVLLSFLFFALGWLFNFQDKGYTFARAIIGVAESPVLLIVLIPAFNILKK